MKKIISFFKLRIQKFSSFREPFLVLVTLLWTLLILASEYGISQSELIKFSSIIFLGVFGYFLGKYSTNINHESPKISDEKIILAKKKEYLTNILNNLKIEIGSKLKDFLEKGDIENANFEIEDKINALNKLVETVRGDETKALRGTDISSISDFYESTNARIRTEIKRIENDSKLNLWVGIAVSVVTIGGLIFTIIEHKTDVAELIPRATLAVLIEVFAFFFFTQYRKQQEEIKYWNNEKTSLDLKIFALSIAIDDENIGDSDFMKNLIIDLIKSERNVFGTTKSKESIEEKPKGESDLKAKPEEILAKFAEVISSFTKK